LVDDASPAKLSKVPSLRRQSTGRDDKNEALLAFGWKVGSRAFFLL